MRELNLDLPKILDWLLLYFQHDEFILTITRLLYDNEVDLVYIINYYLNHLGTTIYGDLFVKTIQYYEDVPPPDMVEWKGDFNQIIDLMKEYDFELYYDATKNKFIKKRNCVTINGRNVVERLVTFGRP